MTITQTGGIDVFEPESDAELSSWQPSNGPGFEFVKLSRHEYWVFHTGRFLGAATRLPHEDAWQAVSGAHGWFMAPLSSLSECAQRLLSRHCAG